MRPTIDLHTFPSPLYNLTVYLVNAQRKRKEETTKVQKRGVHEQEREM